MATPSKTSSLLLFRVGPVLCCAPSLVVNSIILPPTLTHPPGTNLAKPGIFKHGGHIVTCLDLRYQFGVEQTQWVKPGRIVITNLAKGQIGFWIDEIKEVIESPATGWGSLPPLLPRGIFSRTLLIGKEIYLYAEFEALDKIPNHGYLRVYIQHLLEAQSREATTASHRFAAASTTAPIRHSVSNGSTTQTTTASASQPSTLTKMVSGTSSTKQKVTVYTRTPPSVPIDKENAATTKNTTDNKPARLSAKHITRNSETNKTQNQSSRTNKNLSATNTGSLQQSISDRQKITPQTKTSLSGKLDGNTPEQLNNKHQVIITTHHEQEVRKKHGSPELPDKPVSQALHHKDKTQTSFAGIWIFLLLVLLPGSAWFLWRHFQPETTKTIITSPFTSSAQTASPASFSKTPDHETQSSSKQPESAQQSNDTTDTSMYETITTTNDNTRTPLPASQTDTDTTSDQSNPSVATNSLNNDSEDTDLPTSSVKTETSKTEDSSLTPELNVETPAAEIGKTSYRASIERDTEGLTIMIEAPDDVEIFKRNEVVAEVSEENQGSPAQVTGKSELASQLGNVSTSKSPDTRHKPVIQSEVIHIVVKGDTLWHIAIRYLNNPFLYPELARLSNIKNPDLIYPGNRVRIIKRQKKSEN